MSADRTFVTELATGLGMVGCADVGTAIAERPGAIANLPTEGWDRLEQLWDDGSLRPDFEHGFANGRAFLAAPDALNGRPPRIVEWTGPRRPPGDEVVPADLRVDHVYLVSCKYLSKVLHNSSPPRLVDGLLTHAPVGGAGRLVRGGGAAGASGALRQLPSRAGRSALGHLAGTSGRPRQGVPP